ncbi:acetyltransferase [Mycobacterium sp. IS-1742]|uniref:GNAT family N-acetyltransferase n=1 Tax=Mycobacterium sp. IS-1742 TaxID=1772285 RepID=UPI0007401168|nr:GNAT family N-acetyltransferase [Mycobacterium sp. IS-1742]KUI25784.1 acetyltransferase [Mycobacterium sp. IS-1742]
MSDPPDLCRGGRDLPASVALLDGGAVTLRRVTDADRAAITAMAHGLTERERYLRFFTAHPQHIDRWVTTLLQTAADRFTLAAFDGDTLLGVANYVESARPGHAEVAIVVAHGHHHRGIGTVLLDALGHIARANGQRFFVADILAENHEMQTVLSDSSWPCRRHLDGAVVSVEVDLRSGGSDAR